MTTMINILVSHDHHACTHTPSTYSNILSCHNCFSTKPPNSTSSVLAQNTIDPACYQSWSNPPQLPEIPRLLKFNPDDPWDTSFGSIVGFGFFWVRGGQDVSPAVLGCHLNSRCLACSLVNMGAEASVCVCVVLVSWLCKINFSPLHSHHLLWQNRKKMTKTYKDSFLKAA